MCENHKSKANLKEKHNKIREKMETMTRTYHPAEENFENYMEYFKSNIKKAGIIYKDGDDWPNLAWYENWDKICENVMITSTSKIWPNNHKNAEENLYGYMEILKQYFKSINKKVT